MLGGERECVEYQMIINQQHDKDKKSDLKSKGIRTRKDSGASMVEYGLLIALIAVVCVVAVRSLGLTVSQHFNMIDNEIGSVNDNRNNSRPQ